MNLSIDHIFIWTSNGAPEAEHLKEFGLEEGSPNRHPGQWTACRRFFFHNAMLELLWVENETEVQSEAIRPTRLWERWRNRQTGASPFSVCFRPAGADLPSEPFPSWDYRPPYLSPPHVIKIGADTPLLEPMWFYLGFSKRPDSVAHEQRQPLDHPKKLQEMTRVSISVQALHPLSPTARALEQAGVLSMAIGTEPLLNLGYDGEITGQHKDFRPHLPVVFLW
jgi:hypothetical protein